MIEVYVASAFSKDGQGGNKAGVVINRPDLTVEQKLAVAKELGYSETAFVTHSAAADFKLEYFTPTEQVPLCGHATIATFFVLNFQGMLEKSDYTIETLAGILKMRVEADGMIFMEQNCPVYSEILAGEMLENCFVQSYLDKNLPVQIVSTGLADIIMPVDSVEHLAQLEPNFDGISDLSREKSAVGIHAFALSEDKNMTAVCRNFAPLVGIDEESATGTANCALACHLFRYHEKKTQYVFEQGYNLRAVSRIVVNLVSHENIIDAVFVGGYGYMVCQKTLSL